MKYCVTCLKYPDILKKVLNSKGNKIDLLLLDGSCESIAQALADIALLHLPCYIISDAISPQLTKDERSYIISNTLSDIYSETSKLNNAKNQIFSLYFSTLMEHKQLDLLGAIRFRLSHILYEWRVLSILHEKKLRSGENMSEILDFLSLYANTVASNISYAKIIPNNDEYLLIDENKAPIDFMPADLPEFRGMVKEDILLSRLINLSPAKIDASLIIDSQLKLLLFRIFNERILP